MRRLPRIRAVPLLVAAAAGLTGCASGAGAADAGPASVVVRVAPSAHPVELEVHLAQAHGAYRSVHRMRSGETRRFTVPGGWVTVRVPGLCVVPAQNSGTAVVEVDRDACHLV